MTDARNLPPLSVGLGFARPACAAATRKHAAAETARTTTRNTELGHLLERKLVGPAAP
jgi:hypothetical protein